MKYLTKEKTNGIIFLAAVFSCFIAFLNRYPLIYPDTGSYIYSGFNGLVFDDRPIFYGLFLRHISLAASLWFVIFFQALLISYLIYITLGMFIEGAKRNYVFMALIVFLTLTTGYSYTVSVLIPDIFSSMAILCLVNLLLNKELNKLQTIIISVLFVFSICTQFSSLLIILCLFGTLFFYFILKKVRKAQVTLSLKKLILPLTLSLSGLFIIPTVNYLFDRQFKISGSNHVFIMNHLLETGILEDYLKDACEKKDYRICQYKDQLGWNFIWSPESALQKTGGWKANEEEYKLIIRDIVTTPRYLIMLVHKSLEYSLKQFFTFHVTVSAPQLHSSPPYGQLNWRYKDTMREYISSLQSASKLNTDFINNIQQIVILISMVFLCVVLISPALLKTLGFELKWMVAVIMMHNILSAIVCANVSTIDPRFQNRIVWLLPVCSCVIILKWIEQKRGNLKGTGESILQSEQP